MAKVYGQKNNLLPNRSKAASSLPHPLFSMLYGWGLAPAFLASSTLSNGGGRGGDFRAKEEEFILWPQYYRPDSIMAKICGQKNNLLSNR